MCDNQPVPTAVRVFLAVLAALLGAAFLFAVMGLCVKLASVTHSAVEITFYRSFISLLLLCVLVRVQRVPLATPHWRWQLIRGFVGFLAVFSYFYAITLLPLATRSGLTTLSYHFQVPMSR